MHQASGDAAVAETAFGQFIGIGHPVWAAAAMISKAEARGQDDPAAARALYRQAMDAGDAYWSARAAVLLGELLEAQGDLDGAKATWERVIDAPGHESSGAFLNLVNLLHDQEDADGLRAAYQAGAAHGNPGALYALDQLGITVYPARQEPGRWRAVWYEDGERQQCEAASEEKLQRRPGRWVPGQPAAARRRRRRRDRRGCQLSADR